MKRRKNRFKNYLSFWCVLYPACVFLGVVYLSLRLIGLIKVNGLDSFPRGKRSILLVSNHPSLWEPIVLIALFFPEYLLRPLRCLPWSTPDKRNYIDRWHFGIVGSRFIPVPRGARRGELHAIINIAKVLRTGGNVIMFPEGGRTGRGQQFERSHSGKLMRKIKSGIGRVICRADCVVVPVWVDGAENVLPIGTWFPRVWRGMGITVGKPFGSKRILRPNKDDFEKARLAVSKALLETAG